MLSLQRVAENPSSVLSVLGTALGVFSITKGLWKLVRFVGLFRLFKRFMLAANARLGIVGQPGVLTERERRIIEGRTSASERSSGPMIF
ncbi:MAG: hypothetical protein NCW75_07425 [Phycisphaera sp.]|nr:MAG: hypothetical protein NCW75_07425 [Phycisphaera sp.]